MRHLQSTGISFSHGSADVPQFRRPDSGTGPFLHDSTLAWTLGRASAGVRAGGRSAEGPRAEGFSPTATHAGWLHWKGPGFTRPSLHSFFAPLSPKMIGMCPVASSGK